MAYVQDDKIMEARNVKAGDENGDIPWFLILIIGLIIILILWLK